MKRLRFKIKFSLADWWIGIYIDRKDESVYICPLPCILIKVWKQKTPVVTNITMEQVAKVTFPDREFLQEISAEDMDRIISRQRNIAESYFNNAVLNGEPSGYVPKTFTAGDGRTR